MSTEITITSPRSIVEITSNTGTSIIEVNTTTVIQRIGAGTSVWYNAVGDEGNSLLINGTVTLIDNTGASVTHDLTGKTVTAVNRENYELQPTNDFPGNKQFNWAGETPTLTFANDMEAGEQIKITYT